MKTDSPTRIKAAALSLGSESGTGPGVRLCASLCTAFPSAHVGRACLCPSPSSHTRSGSSLQTTHKLLVWCGGIESESRHQSISIITLGAGCALQNGANQEGHGR